MPFGATTNKLASPFGAHTTRRTPAQGSPFEAPTRMHPGFRLSIQYPQPLYRSTPSSTHSHGQQTPTAPNSGGGRVRDGAQDAAAETNGAAHRCMEARDKQQKCQDEGYF
ncbi:hypothetical protein FIBSPDRAFT_864441 [Athelia psychrophila]|uniref:Uncharacterized protein n=1 Tax=Athelia psychrophila TaxID=1759441 RepID=A0A166GGX2_9AGAM|nr:hypothetical protein FIBSPDRAFT_864441 [Fibularhizoctonia sp. CBS 109695]